MPTHPFVAYATRPRWAVALLPTLLVALGAVLATAGVASGTQGARRARPPAPKTGSWFGLGKHAGVAFDVVRSQPKVRHFVLTPPTGIIDRRLCPGVPLRSVFNWDADVKGGRIVNHGHVGLSGRVSGSQARGAYTLPGGCKLRWTATRVHRNPKARDGKWTGSLSNGSSVSFTVSGGGELIQPPSGRSASMFEGLYGSCQGFNFGGALISPSGSFKLSFSDRQPPPIGATGAGSFGGSQAASGTVQGTDSCVTPQLTWTAHR